MTRLVVHVGMHKAGSSSLQHALQGLDSPQARYLDLGLGPNHGGAIHGAFSGHPETYHSFRRREMDACRIDALRTNARRRLVDELDRAHGRLAIISGEDIALLDDASAGDMFHFLSEHVEAIDVVGYVRPPRSFMESAFQQRVKGGLSRLSFPPLYPGYRRRFQKFEALAGRDRTHLFPFVPGLLKDGDVVADFCHRIGIDKPAAELALNPALPRPAVSLLFTYRRFGIAYGTGADEIRANKALLRALLPLAGARIRFAGPALQAVLKRTRADQAWAEARTGCRLEEGHSEEDDCVVCEDDLFRYDEAQLDWLRRWSASAPPWRNATPQAVARCVAQAVPAMVEEFKAEKRRARAEARQALQGAAGVDRCA